MKLLLTMIIIFSFCALSAQNVSPGIPKPKPEQEIWISIGRFPFPYYPDEEDPYGGYSIFSTRERRESPLIEFNGGSYEGTRFTTGTFAAGFYRQISRRWDIGGSFAYTGYYRNIYNKRDNHKIGKYHSNYFSTLFHARVYWYKKLVRVYSGAGLGFYYQESRQKAEGKKENLTLGSTAFHVTLIGISVGRKWFFFCEQGIGTNGVVNAGIGYRFNYQK